MYAFMAVWAPLAYVCLHGCLASTGPCMPSWLFGLHWPMYAFMAGWVFNDLCVPSWRFGLHWPMYAFLAVWAQLAHVCLHGGLASTGPCMPSWLFVFIVSSFFFQGAAPLRFDYGIDPMLTIPESLLEEGSVVGDSIRPSGLHHLRRIDTSKEPHRDLLGGLAERWWISSNTFHFGFGEMTMTPAEFFVISEVPFGTRRLELFRDWRREVPSARMVELIGVDYPRGSAPLCISRTWLTLQMPGLYARFEAGLLSVEQMTRFTVLLLISCAFYTNRRGTVNLNILRSLEYLKRLSDYDWAGFMLAVLYPDMSDLGLKMIKPRGIYYFWEVRNFFSSLTVVFRLVDKLTLSLYSGLGLRAFPCHRSFPSGC